MTTTSTPRSMRRILAPTWRAALAIFARDPVKGNRIMTALSRLQRQRGPRKEFNQ